MLAPILVDFHVCPTCRMKLWMSHGQVIQNFYLQGRKGEAKTHDRESAFVEGDGVITILVTYSYTLKGTWDSPLGRKTNLCESIIKTTYFSKSRNNGRIYIIHPRRWSILLELMNIFLWFIAHVTLSLQLQENETLKKKVTARLEK